MTRLVIEIDTGNAAFTGPNDDPEEDAVARSYECARILRDLARDLEHLSDTSGSLHDINGNRVGSFQFTEE